MSVEKQCQIHKDQQIVAICLDSKCKHQSLSCQKCIKLFHTSHSLQIKQLSSLERNLNDIMGLKILKELAHEAKRQVLVLFENLDVQINKIGYQIETNSKNNHLNSLQEFAELMRNKNTQLNFSDLELEFHNSNHQIQQIIKGLIGNCKKKETEKHNIQQIYKLLKQERLLDAMQLIDSMLEIDNQNLQLNCIKGDVLSKQFKFTEALKLLEDSLIEYPNNSQLHDMKGQIIMRQFQYEENEAKEHINKIISPTNKVKIIVRRKSSFKSTKY